MPVSDYRPTVQDIALLLRARTRDAIGNLVKDFTDDTLPTAEDVEGLITTASDDVSGEIGPDIESDYLDTAKVLVIYLTAANIELSYYPEQAAVTNSMYDKLMARFNTKLAQLKEDLELAQGSTGSNGTDGGFGWGNWDEVGGGYPLPYFWRYAQW